MQNNGRTKRVERGWVTSSQELSVCVFGQELCVSVSVVKSCVCVFGKDLCVSVCVSVVKSCLSGVESVWPWHLDPCAGLPLPWASPAWKPQAWTSLKLAELKGPEIWPQSVTKWVSSFSLLLFFISRLMTAVGRDKKTESENEKDIHSYLLVGKER